VSLLGLVLLFVAATAASTAASAHPFQSFIRSTTTPWILAAVLLAALVARHLRPWIRPALVALLIVLAVGAVWQLATGFHLEGGRLWRVPGFLPHPNDTALVAVALPLAPAFAWPVGLLVILLSGSRNALLGVVAAALVLTRSWRARLLILAGLAVAVLTLTHAAAVSSVTARVGHWLVAAQMFREAPLLGKGPHTFVDYYLTYVQRMTLPFGLQPEIAFVPWAHSLYLEQLAERGLLGALVFALPLWLAWRRGDRALRAALTSFLVMGVVDLSLLKPWVVGAYWSLVALALTAPAPVVVAGAGWRVRLGELVHDGALRLGFHPDHVCGNCWFGDRRGNA
jgi:O-antigen ligase